MDKTIRVLVHDGGPRFSSTEPELVSVNLLNTEGIVMVGQVLDAPRHISSVAVGDTIKFIDLPAHSHPIMVTDKYLIERRHSYVIPGDERGCSELFDAPSDLARVVFPGQHVSTFTTKCPVCGGGQLVRLLPPEPMIPRDAGESEVEAAVISVVADCLDISSSRLQLTEHLTEQGADDLDLVSVVFALEEHFVVRIPDSTIGEYASLSISNLIKIVKRALAQRRDEELL